MVFERFNAIVRSKDKTVKEIANEAGVNYARLLQVLKGRKRIKEKDLTNVLNHHLFSKEEVDEVLHLHRFTDVDEECRQRVVFFESVLMNLYKTVTEKDSLPTLISKGYESIEPVQNSCELINDHIFLSYANKARLLLMKQTDATFKIDFYLPAIEPVLHEIYHTLNALIACFDKHLTIDIRFNIYVPENGTEAFLDALLNLVKYFKLTTLNAKLSMVGLQEPHIGEEGYDYYVCLEDRRIWLNADATKSFVVHKEQDTFFNSRKDSDLLSFSEKFNTDDLNAYLFESIQQKQYMKSKMRNLRFSFNSLVFDHDLMKEVMENRVSASTKSFKEMHLLEAYQKRIDIGQKRLKSNGDIKQYLCGAGIINFIQDGVLNDYAEFVGYLSEYERLLVIKNALEVVRETDSIRIILPEEGKKYEMLSVLRFFEIYLDLDQLMVIKHFRFKDLRFPKDGFYNIDGRTIKHALKFSHDQLIQAWLDYTDVFLASIATTQSGAIAFIENLIAQYYKDSKDPKVQAIVSEIFNESGKSLEIN